MLACNRYCSQCQVVAVLLLQHEISRSHNVTIDCMYMLGIES